MKYGFCSMKEALEDEFRKINSTISMYNMSDLDKETILLSFKKLAYQLCTSNAWSCAVEQSVIDRFGIQEYLKSFGDIEKLNSTIKKKIDETFPFKEDV